MPPACPSDTLGIMSHPPPPGPGAPRRTPPGRPQVGALRRALESAARPLLDPSRAAAAAESVRRIAQAVVDNGAAEGRPDVQAATTAVLDADGPRLTAATGALIDLLRRTDQLALPGGDLILIVEDDPQFARMLQVALDADGRRVVVAESAAEARAALAQEVPSLLILDLILPDSDGRNLLLELRSKPRTAALPVLVVTARLGGEVKSECFALGAEAYFEKPIDSESFAVAVACQLERQVRYTQMCRRDPVTGLPNRAAFLETCAQLRDGLAPDTPMSLAVLDLDHFRYLEERWGRGFAESVLHQVGARLALALRSATSFARWDGAEFIALFAGQSSAEASLPVAQALELLRRVEFECGEEPPLVVTFSAGVTDVAAGQSFEETLAAADRLLHTAKMTGRSRVVSSDAAVSVPARRILLAEDDPDVVRILSRYLTQEGFEILHYPNGRLALEAAPRSGAALVISDIDMPELDGLGLLRALRAQSGTHHLPVMMLTAVGDENYIVRAFELGADDYVTKPFSTREVAARIRRLLRRPSMVGIPAAG